MTDGGPEAPYGRGCGQGHEDGYDYDVIVVVG